MSESPLAQLERDADALDKLAGDSPRDLKRLVVRFARIAAETTLKHATQLIKAQRATVRKEVADALAPIADVRRHLDERVERKLNDMAADVQQVPELIEEIRKLRLAVENLTSRDEVRGVQVRALRKDFAEHAAAMSGRELALNFRFEDLLHDVHGLPDEERPSFDDYLRETRGALN